MIDSELDVEALHEALTSGEAARQLSAIDVLLECDRRGPLADELLGPLLDALGHDRKAVQRTAAEVLSLWSRATPEIPDRLRVLVRSGPLRHRFGAAFALAKLGPDPETLPVLLETLGEADGDMRWAAATLVLDLVRRRPEMRERLVALAKSGSPGQRKMSLYCLRDLDLPSPLHPPLPLGERSAAKPPGVGETLEEILLSNLHHGDPGVRLAALAALGKHFTQSETALREVLRLAATDDDVGVRRAAVSRVTDYPAAASDAEASAVLQSAEASEDPALRRAAEAARRRAARATGDSS